MKEIGLAYDIELEIRKSPLYRQKQIETHIGERLNALLSRTTYEIREGIIYGFGLSEPFVDVMRAGVGHGIPQDRPREEAEVIGFEKIQEILTNAADGTTVISISPKGQDDSVYKHNFYDIFTLRQAHGKRFIEARRYSAGLSWEEFGEKAKSLGFQKEASDVSFLSNPFVVQAKPDEIHKFFHKDHEYISEEDYLFILKLCLPSILYYANHPSELSFNAALNKADYLRENLERIKNGALDYYDIATRASTDTWGLLPVRPAATGCGYSKGAWKDAFSVSDLSEDKYGPRSFNCPSCGRENIRPKDQLISKCQHCGSAKVAC